ncbi:MAG: hypothetical protein AAGA46_13195 [Cyanobacteria bacterium P01_F01_bin.13]
MQAVCEPETTWQDTALQTIEGKHYLINYNAKNASVEFRNFLELSPAQAHTVVNDLVPTLLQHQPTAITLDLRNLIVPTAPGIIMIAEFIINVRNHRVSSLAILGSHSIPWHEPTLKKLKQLLPTLDLILE